MQTAYKSYEIVAKDLPAGAPAENLLRIIADWTAEAKFAGGPGPRFRLDLSVVHGSELGEGYEIRVSDGGAAITSNHIRGIYAGVGALLRSCSMSERGFTPGIASHISRPSKSLRGMYFATHFHNFYHTAPAEQVVKYIEDISLWGLNTLIVWFDFHHFRSMEAPEAAAFADRLKIMLRAAKNVGMDIGFTLLANEGFSEGPEELRATNEKQNGYLHRIEFYHTEICPSKPGGQELIMKWREDFFKAFADTEPDLFCIWPYDQGGCTCADCLPWGANGFLRVAPGIAEMARKYFPGIKIILSCWNFDVCHPDDWPDFKKVFSNDPKWVDYLLVEPRGEYKNYPCTAGELYGLPVVGFPEISMFYATPWGGFGANPYPHFIENIWRVSGPVCDGGYAYSEGIFEDLNKFLVSRMYWHGAGTDFRAAVREYAAAYYSGEYADELAEAIIASERALDRKRWLKGADRPTWPESWAIKNDPEGTRYVMVHPENVNAVYDAITRVDALLREPVRSSWRWRILYLRAVIDKELVDNDYNMTPLCEKAYIELMDIYGTPDPDWTVKPPVQRWPL